MKYFTAVYFNNKSETLSLQCNCLYLAKWKIAGHFRTLLEAFLHTANFYRNYISCVIVVDITDIISR